MYRNAQDEYSEGVVYSFKLVRSKVARHREKRMSDRGFTMVQATLMDNQSCKRRSQGTTDNWKVLCKVLVLNSLEQFHI